ncbi:ABC transporter permease [Arthrobacter sp. PAMC25564]|uniref:FtsX-like permease family protein n=1 Tax=Arthrobacter sp. PAMC25564 TaxID=2565366 RepID=UPI001F0DDC72|nr:ABC transporter permease [Arthrobacter sp. PAMC25564]
MGSGSVFVLFSTEAAFIGFLGSAVGSAAAIGLGTAVSGALARGHLRDLEGLHILTFAPGSVAGVILLVMAIAFIAGTLPAWRAAKPHRRPPLRISHSTALTGLATGFSRIAGLFRRVPMGPPLELEDVPRAGLPPQRTHLQARSAVPESAASLRVSRRTQPTHGTKPVTD